MFAGSKNEPCDAKFTTLTRTTNSTAAPAMRSQ
jgi:hypothetical protein